MKKSLTLSIIAIAVTLFTYAQTPTILWQTTIGGSNDDSLVSILPTSDGGFIVSGHSNSNISGNKSQNSVNNSFDYWIMKLTSTGRIQWDKTIGGDRTDRDPVVIPTIDNGWLVGGTSNSDSSGSKTEYDINDSYDYWVVKLNNNGSVQWNNTLGGIQLDVLSSLAQRLDGTYMIGGYSYTRGDKDYDKSDPNRGSSLWPDYWLVKLDKRGKKVVWNKVYGGKNEDILASMQTSKDSGYVLAGYSYSEADYEKTQTYLGNNDYWLVKVDANGNKLWDRVVGGRLSDYLTSFTLTSDGGYVLAGYSNSPISYNKSGDFKGIMDYWIIKLDSNLNVRWDRTFGGTGGDYLSSVQQTSDGGYIVGGTSNSNISANKSENSKGAQDYWIMKLNGNGQIVWDKTIGGSGIDRLSMIKEISPGEYILGGTSNSPVSGDKTDPTVGGTGQNDYWIIRLSTNASAQQKTTSPQQLISTSSNNADANIRNISMQVSPNPTKGLVTINYTGVGNNKLNLLIYDNSGKTILKTSLIAGKNSYSADLSKQAPGTYYVLLSSGTSSVTRVIIKE